LLTTQRIPGKVTLDDEEFDLNQEFRDVVLMLSDETESSELGAARVLLESQDDVQAMGRPLLQCGLLRFHQQRRYALDSLRLLLELDRISEEETSEALDRIKQFVDTTVFAAPPGSTQRPAERCLAAMAHVRALLKKVADKITAASFLDRNQLGELSGDMQTIEFSRVSLYQQHELLGVVLSRIIEKNLGKQQDFTLLLDYFKKADRYDAFLGGFSGAVLQSSMPHSVC
jgi:nuclear pore complex protein Nup205